MRLYGIADHGAWLGLLGQPCTWVPSRLVCHASPYAIGLNAPVDQPDPSILLQ